MRKRWFISLIIGIIITGGCLGYLQFGRDMDVYGSHAMTADNYHEERLTVVVNKLYVEDQKVCAEEIVRRCRENSFKSVRFSYDQLIPNGKVRTADIPSLLYIFQKCGAGKNYCTHISSSQIP